MLPVFLRREEAHREELGLAESPLDQTKAGRLKAAGWLQMGTEFAELPAVEGFVPGEQPGKGRRS
jgi:hypothetical protein